jgi:hypothetical protein
MFNNVVFNKAFIIRPMIISGRVIKTLLVRNTQGDGATQDYRNFLFFENRSVCEIMWKNTVQPNRPQMTI